MWPHRPPRSKAVRSDARADTRPVRASACGDRSRAGQAPSGRSRQATTSLPFRSRIATAVSCRSRPRAACGQARHDDEVRDGEHAAKAHRVVPARSGRQTTVNSDRLGPTERTAARLGSVARATRKRLTMTPAGSRATNRRPMRGRALLNRQFELPRRWPAVLPERDERSRTRGFVALPPSD